MSSRSGNILGRKKVEQLLRAVGSQSAEDAAQVEFDQYDWHDPHYFSSEQLVELNDFTQLVAQAMATRFSDFCRSPYDVTVTSITQHFAGEYLDKASEGEQNDYSVLFGATAEHPCGLIGMPEQTASTWARELLGDSESQEDLGMTLSPLEESLLLDLTSALVEAFSESNEACSFCLAGNLIRVRLPLDLSGTEELCKISLDVKKGESEGGSEAYLLVPCRELAPVTGKVVRAAGQFSENEISRAILDHLQEMTVAVTAQLDSTMLTFEETVNLQVNDMLLLDRTVNETIEVIVEGQTVFNGRLAKSAGKYAVAIAAVTGGDSA
jgi:flagellar motor switch protein FliM